MGLSLRKKCGIAVVSLCEVRDAELIVDKARRQDASTKRQCESSAHMLPFSSAGRLQYDGREVNDASVSWQRLRQSSFNTCPSEEKWHSFYSITPFFHRHNHSYEATWAHRFASLHAQKYTLQKVKIYVFAAKKGTPHWIEGSCDCSLQKMHATSVYPQHIDARASTTETHTSGNYGQTVRRFSVQKTGSGYQLH